MRTELFIAVYIDRPTRTHFFSYVKINGCFNVRLNVVKGCVISRSVYIIIELAYDTGHMYHALLMHLVSFYGRIKVRL